MGVLPPAAPPPKSDRPGTSLHQWWRSSRAGPLLTYRAVRFLTCDLLEVGIFLSPASQLREGVQGGGAIVPVGSGVAPRQAALRPSPQVFHLGPKPREPSAGRPGSPGPGQGHVAHRALPTQAPARVSCQVGPGREG